VPNSQVVAPHVGAWIEILLSKIFVVKRFGAPHVGAWIEIHCVVPWLLRYLVAPHVGAWIEIISPFLLFIKTA